MRGRAVGRAHEQQGATTGMDSGAALAATRSATDADLVAAIRAGDESAFEELFKRYQPRVHAFVQRRVGDDGRAEELTQEAFLSALRRLRETEGVVVFRPWIYEIARNSTIDHFRRRSRTREVSVDVVEGLRPSEHARLNSDRGPEREVAAKEQLETLQGALDELSARHGTILIMRELEGLSYREIGERLHLTRPGVESTLFRARRRLEVEFAELETGRRCTAVRGAMGRLTEGLELRGDRGLVKRHARRCAGCRTTARGLGLVLERPSKASRLAALLPLPALPGAFGVKTATAVVASAALVGGGATLGDVVHRSAVPDAQAAGGLERVSEGRAAPERRPPDHLRTPVSLAGKERAEPRVDAAKAFPLADSRPVRTLALAPPPTDQQTSTPGPSPRPVPAHAPHPPAPRQESTGLSSPVPAALPTQDALNPPSPADGTEGVEEPVPLSAPVDAIRPPEAPQLETPASPPSS
jgi:RNA polymerase sigma factor (sigma-70 family)